MAEDVPISIVIPDTRQLLTGISRAFAGALVFSLPMMMTMEMWDLGFTIPEYRLALMLLLTLPLLVGLSRFGGFRETVQLSDDVADAMVGMGVAFVTALVVLWICGQITGDMSLRESLGKVAIQMIPGSIGALLAQNQLGGTAGREKRRMREPTYLGELFLMVVGALFLSLNIAPTDEVALISYAMSVSQQLLLMALSLLLMHGFVYMVEFHGTHQEEGTLTSIFLRFTVVGYALALVVSLLLLWVFERTDGTSLEEIFKMAVVLAFPGAIGAAVARLAL
ncbi:TIGR02587 family membrane protein [Rhodoligotrophos ferricapiens]|uniref:TIGR02587 family membrane protein n=1 Tax=Rhodoligotrophos ferricapiens TaxID=3069264 RepID=UPI00315DA38A